MLIPGKLQVSVIGLSENGDKKLTTKKMDIPVTVLEAGPQDGSDPASFTPELWEQALSAIGDLTSLTTTAKSSIVSALNELAAKGGTGTGSGSDGVGIDNIAYKDTDDEGNYIYTITLTNGDKYYITAPRGPAGTSGASKKISYIRVNTRTPSGGLIGDINGDGIVDSADVDHLAQCIVNGKDLSLDTADFNGDGVVTNSDVFQLSKLVENLSAGQIISRIQINYTDGTNNTIFGYIDAQRESSDSFYIPMISQPDDNTMLIEYRPSKEGMTEVESMRIMLPAGPRGEKGDKGDTGPQGIQGIQGEKGDIGPQGMQGIQGEKGDTGPQGMQGIQGEKGEKGDKGDTGARGPQGTAGKDGQNGKDGYTPVRGVDYFTNADQEAIVQQVITALGTPVFGRVDEENNIILTGELADGTYTLKYEDADGTLTNISTLTLTSMVNLADPTSSDWWVDRRLNSSEQITNCTGCNITNFIPCGAGDVVRVKGLNIAYYDNGATRSFVRFYTENTAKSAFSIIPADNLSVFDKDGDTWTFTVGEGLSGNTSNIKYVRMYGDLFSGYAKEDVIITVNQPIE